MPRGTLLRIPQINLPGTVRYNDRVLEVSTESSTPGQETFLPRSGDTVDFDLEEIDGKTRVTRLRPPAETGAELVQPVNPEPAKANSVNADAPNRPAPYTFVPVVTDGAKERRPLFNAVSHDGSNGADLLSGELRLVMEALTPLLVGQYRYKLSDSDLAHLTGNEYEKEKQILEPLFHSTGEDWPNRRVLIPGSSIKGMLRHSIGAILNAPMERVAERNYSYRPNLGLVGKNKVRLQPRAAVIDSIDDNGISIRLVEHDEQPLFVQRPEDPKGHPTAPALRPGAVLPNGTSLPDYRQDHNRLLLGSEDPWPADHDFLVLCYAGGLDGEGALAKASEAINANAVTRIHHRILIRPTALAKDPIRIDATIVEQYERTQDELTNAKTGHLADHPAIKKEDEQDKSKKKVTASEAQDALGRHRDLDENQLIYVELDANGKVVSFGHNFRYWWGYADSVRRLQRDRTGNRTDPRPELHPLEDEGVRLCSDAQGNRCLAGQLSGARLLFGYAEDSSEESGNRGIGGADLPRFAGRIAINHALEQIQPEKADYRDRFLTMDRQGTPHAEPSLIPLRILGTPKPSAVEHYLRQADLEHIHGATRTYGDLPGVEESGEPLNGRKFYRHQPIRGLELPLRQNDDQPFLARTDVYIDKERTTSEVRSKQGTLARHVSRPGTRFRFTLRFRDLYLWELGAVLVTLKPGLLAGSIEGLGGSLEPAGRVIAAAGRISADNAEPQFAQKLGYGRPLGLGSVCIEPKSARLLESRDGQPVLTDLQEQDFAACISSAVKAFLQEIEPKDHQLAAWLQVVQYAGCRPADYPRKNGKIFEYHTAIRKEHSRQRRLADIPGGKQPVDEPVR